MALRLLLGIGIGAGAGFGYHHLMCAVGSRCINARFPAVPISLGIAAGIFFALSRR